MLASRAWIPRLGWALVIVGLTILLGPRVVRLDLPVRHPAGVDLFRKARQRAKAISPRWRMVKYVLLVVILVGALFGNLTLLIFEPLALFTRFMTTRGHPGANYVVNATESTLYSFAFLRPAISWLETVVRGPDPAGRAARIWLGVSCRQPVLRHPRSQFAGRPVLVSLSMSSRRAAGLAVENLHPAPPDRPRPAPAAPAAPCHANRGRSRPFPLRPDLPVKSRSCPPNAPFAWTAW